MTLIAKPVIDKQFWILQDGNQKIGNVEACADGYQVKINNQVTQFKTIRMLQKQINIEFQTQIKSTTKPQWHHEVHGYPTVCKAHNSIWNVPSKLPLYTKTNKSKSWYAAGWYRIRSGRNWTVVQDPKLILLQRYAYQGPFYTQEDANEYSSAKIC